MVGNMFSDDYGGINGTNIGFYGNDGVCLFKYFVTPTDPQKIFSLAILLINFVCFVLISASYAMVIFVTNSSGQAVGSRQDNPANARNMALQRKVSMIILSDFSCWFPFLTIGLLHFANLIDASKYYELCSIIILPINSVINPLIYHSEFQTLKDTIVRTVRRTFIRREEIALETINQNSAAVEGRDTINQTTDNDGSYVVAETTIQSVKPNEIPKAETETQLNEDFESGDEKACGVIEIANISVSEIQPKTIDERPATQIAYELSLKDDTMNLGEEIIIDEPAITEEN